MKMPFGRYILILLLTVIAGVISLPANLDIPVPFTNPSRTITIGSPKFIVTQFGQPFLVNFEFKKGLDIQGGMQILLDADMSSIPEEDRMSALDSAREVILRRVDLYGIAEPVVQTSVSNGNYRLVVELPGVQDPDQALQLVGQTAQLDFQLIDMAAATASA